MRPSAIPCAALAACCLIAAPFAHAASRDDLVFDARETLARLYALDARNEPLVASAYAVLIFPQIIKVAVGAGGEQGEGVLRVRGKYLDTYVITGGTISATVGFGRRSLVVVFRDENMLDKLISREGLTIGGNANVRLDSVSSGEDPNALQSPIVGFVLDQRGLLGDVSLEGCRIRRK